MGPFWGHYGPIIIRFCPIYKHTYMYKNHMQFYLLCKWFSHVGLQQYDLHIDRPRPTANLNPPCYFMLVHIIYTKIRTKTLSVHTHGRTSPGSKDVYQTASQKSSCYHPARFFTKNTENPQKMLAYFDHPRLENQ